MAFETSVLNEEKAVQRLLQRRQYISHNMFQDSVTTIQQTEPTDSRMHLKPQRKFG
jgi:hypothetical protein